MTEQAKVSISKFISRVLRHNPASGGVTLDPNGWADTGALLEGMNRTRHSAVTFAELQEVVRTNDKQRFSFNEDCTKIRANQGHSIKVDVELKEVSPPVVLYHGTAERYINAIEAEGLKPQGRLYVHLSDDEATAIKVGRRHGEPALLTIDTVSMCKDGFKFFLSENGVWLTECVPAKYLQRACPHQEDTL